MLDVIEQLLVLQDRDQKIMRLQEELSRIEPERHALLSKADSSKEALKQAKTEAQQVESNRKDLELQVESKKKQIDRYASQQLETKKNEEYQAFNKEIDTCKKDIENLEDQELELMETYELKLAAIAEAEKVAQEAQSRADEQVADLKVREANQKKEKQELEEERIQLADKIDPSVLARYDRLLKKKQSKVVVGINRGVCAGCHMSLPTQVQVSCKAQSEIVNCSNCGRIVYYTRDMELNL
jgi:predicted  nucleic acid-binding Zn-ribbon protein